MARSDDIRPSVISPTVHQDEQGTDHAAEVHTGVSVFTQAMVASGRTRVTSDPTPDEPDRELCRRRNDVRDDLVHGRERIDDLESQLLRSERGALIQLVEDTPGMINGEIGQRVVATAPDRLSVHLKERERWHHESRNTSSIRPRGANE